MLFYIHIINEYILYINVYNTEKGKVKNINIRLNWKNFIYIIVYVYIRYLITNIVDRIYIYINKIVMVISLYKCEKSYQHLNIINNNTKKNTAHIYIYISFEKK